MNTYWVWDFVFDIVLPGIGLGLLGLVVWNGLAYSFFWLKCRYGNQNKMNKEEEK